MDLFRVLGAGAKFDRKRFRQDHELFKASSHDDTSVSISDTATVTTTLAPELDFFSANQPAPDISKEADGTNGRTAKRRKIHDGDASNPTDSKPTFIPFDNETTANAYRKEHHIKVYGTDVPHPLQSFHELVGRFQIKSFLQRNLDDSGYTVPTPIQMQSIPIMLHGRELMACAPTGSGKTLAYILPILHDLKWPAKEGVRAVIICPTRELATQIHREMKKLSHGKPFRICVLTKVANSHAGNDSAVATFKNFDILISTPLRLVHAIQHQSLKLNTVRHLILDEADKLLELGFLEQMDEIFAACSSTVLHKSLFSATIPSGVEQLAKTFMTDPIRVVIGQKNAATETINQKLLYVGQEEGKLIAIRQLVQEGGLKPPVLIFLQSIDRAKELFKELVYDGINVDVIHSERTKAQRDNIVQSFRQGKVWVLIATELMARGIDFKGVKLVINYDFPQSVASYVHRIGRTGRAGRAGEAITFFTKEDAPYLKTVVNVMRDSGCEVPEWMLQLKNPSKNEKKNLKQKPVKRDNIKTVSSYDERKLKHKRAIIEASKRRNVKAIETVPLNVKTK
ncbi:P-loop containing nucleoside triphosphate hydrolase protein [Gaertneriomyces semiglobifer]|nr:P-loop containing nucleoside triphosphate hydrolase protein [Gaertneriomyces semiglobifer]